MASHDQADRRTTIRDVAKSAGLGIGTVSRVINNRGDVSVDARRRVEEAVRALGFTPDELARGLRTKSTRAVGFMIPDISNPLFSTIARNAEEVLHNAGYSLVLANTANRPERDIELLTLFRGRRVDALILALSREDDPAVLAALKQIRVPVVLLDRKAPIPADLVLSDHMTGMNQATEYLIQLGHRRIALITLRNDTGPDRARIEGFLNAHRAAGLKHDDALLRHVFSSTEIGFHDAEALLKMENPPSVIIAGSNQIFIGVWKAISQSGWCRVPDNLSLVACDDTPLTELAWPPVTVIYRDIEKIGRRAAELLVDRLTGRETGDPRRVVIPTELIVRKSCAPVRRSTGTRRRQRMNAHA